MRFDKFDVNGVISNEIVGGNTFTSQLAPLDSVGDGPREQVWIDSGSLVDWLVALVIVISPLLVCSSSSSVIPDRLGIVSHISSSFVSIAKGAFSVPIIEH